MPMYSIALLSLGTEGKRKLKKGVILRHIDETIPAFSPIFIRPVQSEMTPSIVKAVDTASLAEDIAPFVTSAI